MSPDPNEFEVPDGYGNDIGDPLEGEGVRLPFEAPYLWWTNGKSGYQNEGGPRFFGGWSMTSEDMDAAIDRNAGVTPAGWKNFEMMNEEGGTYSAYLSRVAYVAVLGTRTRWVVDQASGKGKSQYQALCYLAYVQDKKIIPFTPAVLTAKSTAGMFLRDAISDFNTKTRALRKKYANDLPISAFFAMIGSFGDTPNIKAVGKTTKKNVTAMTLYMPKTLDEGFLRTVFIGKELAGVTAGLRKEASEWLAAWKKAPAAAQPQAAQPAYQEDDDYPAPPDDDLPPF